MATCPKCGYSWQSKATADWITCPQCQRKFKRPVTVIETIGAIAGGPLIRCNVCEAERTDIVACYIDGEPAFVCAECLGLGDWEWPGTGSAL